ncbi:DUF2269 family protein [Lederbergia wuyishanensis]|uniref:Membrane protein n=1 Tax=Lederbergia wuyishanensis TaxID=1347903 RepID=A0ABU0D8Y7_9BACI|nr:DUF2269 family protein [Lederbergia wuyishanensis]MCJ8007615.1 DUF2269 domain-containing protein [Lederbergia wuyishanensis]MDQ0344801.1 putative membrane protein [Lederbergia wuyishanensis]
MATFYKILVFIHIFSAILGMGPGFILSQIGKSANTITELKLAYKIKNRIHIFVMIGGTLLLVSGVLMGTINTSLFRQGWYITSLILFLLALAMGPIVLSPISKPLKAKIKAHEGDEIPEEYKREGKKLLFYEHIASFIFLVIIALMILKPF